MARWEPNARERLQEAALELFEKRGYAQTTVEEIAARAGLTERTFFRYFTDKREVLFWGSERLLDAFADAVAGAPRTAAPLDAVTFGLDAAAQMIPPSRERAKKRRKLVEAHAELRERELLKMTTLAASIAAALRKRGVTEPAASLTAEAGVAIFKIGFVRWTQDHRDDLAHHLHASLAELRTVASVAPSRVKSRRA